MCTHLSDRRRAGNATELAPPCCRFLQVPHVTSFFRTFGIQSYGAPREKLLKPRQNVPLTFSPRGGMSAALSSSTREARDNSSITKVSQFDSFRKVFFYIDSSSTPRNNFYETYKYDYQRNSNPKLWGAVRGVLFFDLTDQNSICPQRRVPQQLRSFPTGRPTTLTKALLLLLEWTQWSRDMEPEAVFRQSLN